MPPCTNMTDNLSTLSHSEIEAELKKYKDIVAMFSNTVMGGIARMSVKDLTLINATDGYYRMTGYTKEESLLPPFSNCGINLVLPEDLERLSEKVNLLIYENQPIRADYRIRKKDGGIAWNSAFCPGVQSNEGDPYIEIFFLDTTLEKNTQLQLASLIDNMVNGLIRMEIHDGIQILYANNEFYRLTGYKPEDFSAPPVSNNFLEIIHPDDREALLSSAQSLLNSGHSRKTVTFRIAAENSEIRWLRAYISRLYEELPAENVLQCVLSDITKEREQEQQIRLNEERFRIISEQTRDVIFDWDMKADHLHYSPVFEKVFGYPPPPHMSTAKLLFGNLYHEDDKVLVAKAIEDLRTNKPYIEFKARLRAKDGTYFWALHRATAIRGENSESDPGHVVGIISDVNDLMKNTLDLQRKASHELLTGLLNRAAAEDLIKHLLADSISSDKHAFILFDIDHFKQINDFMGHAAGDLALKRIARQMKELFRDSDVLARMGGDEFAIFLVRVKGRENVIKKLKQLVQTIYCDFKYEEKIYPLSISIGAALYPDDGKTFQELYERADSAMYMAKRKGGNRFEMYKMEIS